MQIDNAPVVNNEDVVNEPVPVRFIVTLDEEAEIACKDRSPFCEAVMATEN